MADATLIETRRSQWASVTATLDNRSVASAPQTRPVRNWSVSVTRADAPMTAQLKVALSAMCGGVSSRRVALEPRQGIRWLTRSPVAPAGLGEHFLERGRCDRFASLGNCRE